MCTQKWHDGALWNSIFCIFPSKVLIINKAMPMC
jgi:hypothetical protein